MTDRKLSGTEYIVLRNVDTRWTPLTDELRDVIERLVLEAGTWKLLAEVTGVRLRYIRRLRQRKETTYCKPLKCVSLGVLDRLLRLSSQSYMIERLPWYTIEELQQMGLWKEPLPHMRSKRKSG